VGKNLPTSLTEQVRVEMVETDGRDAVLIEPVAGAAAVTEAPA
jgi:pyrimidine operon attenuation protein/uracil phosphoribosyltransferase